jgi:hypothetical protein
MGLFVDDFYLTRKSWRFNSALKAKRKTLLAAISLVCQLEKTMPFNHLSPDEKSEFSAAMTTFKRTINYVNNSRGSAQDMWHGSNTFFDTLDNASFSQHLPESYAVHTASYRKALSEQNNHECLRSFLKKIAAVVLLSTFFLGVLPGCAFLLAAFPLLGVFLIPLPLLTFVLLLPQLPFLIGAILFSEGSRDIVGEGIAVEDIDSHLMSQPIESAVNDRDDDEDIPMVCTTATI